MSSWLTSPAVQLGETAAKAALLYVTALLALRVGERRTLAQWTVIDFAAAVAIGAIIGRTATATSTTYLVGAVALVTLVVIHRLASVARFSRLLTKLVDHRVRLLVVDGTLQRRQLRWCGLTDEDVYAELRQRGLTSLRDVRYLLYEAKGGLTVVPRDVRPPADLVDAGLEAATTRPPSDAAEEG